MCNVSYLGNAAHVTGGELQLDLLEALCGSRRGHIDQSHRTLMPRGCWVQSRPCQVLCWAASSLPPSAYLFYYVSGLLYYLYGDCRGSVRGEHRIAVLFITCFDFRASVRLTCKIIGKKIFSGFLFRHGRKMFTRNNNMTLVLLFTQDIPKYFNKNIFFLNSHSGSFCSGLEPEPCLGLGSRFRGSSGWGQPERLFWKHCSDRPGYLKSS